MKGYHAQLVAAVYTALSGTGYTVDAYPADNRPYPFIQPDQFNPRDWGTKGCYGVEVDLLIHAWDKAKDSAGHVCAMLDKILLAFPESYNPSMTDWTVCRSQITIPGQIVPNVDREVVHGIVQVTFWIQQK